MSDNKNAVSFSGHRESKLPKNLQVRKQLDEQLEHSIITAVETGYHIFYTGLCNGFDLIAAEKVLKIPDQSIKLIGVVPHEEQEAEWPDDEKIQYRNIRDSCHEIVVLNETKVRGCYYQRNRYMVDRSALLLCYCSSLRGGTAYTLEYARKKGLLINNIFNK